MPRCKYHNTKFTAKYFLQKYCLEDEDCRAAQRKERAEKSASKVFKPKTAIPFFSAKRTIENPIYSKERLRFLAQPENHRCFIEGCGKRADTIEHTMGKKGFADKWARDNGITLYLDVRFWKPCCWGHNGELERNTELSLKYQLSKISGKEKIKKQSIKN